MRAVVTTGDGYVALHTDVPIPTPGRGEVLVTSGFTGCQVLWQNNRFASLKKPATDLPPILIWGGASAVGQYVIQLAKLSGLQVVTTVSPKNALLLLLLGADIIFDYRDPEVIAKIREFTSNKLGYTIDCMSSGDIPELIRECMGPLGGYVGCVLIAPVPRPDVTSEFVLVYTLLGKAFEFPFSSPPNPEHYEDGKRYAWILSNLLVAGKLQTMPTKIVSHGLAEVQMWMDDINEKAKSAERKLCIESVTK